MRVSILRVCAVAGLLVASGCQTLPPTGKGINFTYAGKELPPTWIREQQQLDASNGHEFRGFYPYRRHWFR